MKRPTIRLAVGGEAWPKGQENTKAQWLFLGSVRRCVPTCFASLLKLAAHYSASDLESPKLLAFDSELRAWMKRWNFDAGFLRNTATRTARRAVEHPEIATKDWALSGGYWAVEVPALDRSTWNPVKETEASFRRRVDAYIDHVKAQPGLVWLQKREPAHFDWLALFHVKGLSYDQILTRYRLDDPDRLRKAIRDTAIVVGITLASGVKRKQKRAR